MCRIWIYRARENLSYQGITSYVNTQKGGDIKISKEIQDDFTKRVAKYT